MYSNTSTSSHDLFLTLTITRHSGSALGWTAVGAGNRMNGVRTNPNGLSLGLPCFSCLRS
jgi:S-adenosylmethionine synthetase